MNNVNSVNRHILVQSGIYKDIKIKKEGSIIKLSDDHAALSESITGLNNTTNTLRKIENIAKNKDNVNKFSLNNAMNYVYLGATNMPIVSNMGVTLDSDGSLLFIKGKSRDLFSGLVNKYIKEYKYKGFKAVAENDNPLKEKTFSKLFVDNDGFLIGKDKTTGKECKIILDRERNSYNKNTNNKNESMKLIINYEDYNPSTQEISDNEENITSPINDNVTVNREGQEISLKLEAGEVFISGLEGIVKPITDDVVDSAPAENWHKLKLPLSNSTKIRSIDKIKDMVKLTVEKEGKFKVYYLNPLYISSIKENEFKLSRLLSKPPQSLYASLGTDGFERYYSGQPFNSQHIGNYSSRNIPIISSILNDFRVNIDNVRHNYAMGAYREAFKSTLKFIDPGLKSIITNIKSLFLSPDFPIVDKGITLDQANYNKKKFINIFNKVVRGIHNGKSQAEVCLSIINNLKPEESIIINDVNDLGLFFSTKIMPVTSMSSLSVGLMAGYSKTHSIVMKKNKDNEIVLSFINKTNLSATFGATVGAGTSQLLKINDHLDIGASGPLMATLLLSGNYGEKTDFSFALNEEDFRLFIDGYSMQDIIEDDANSDTDSTNDFSFLGKDYFEESTLEEKIIEKSSLGYQRTGQVSLDVDGRVELKTSVDVATSQSTNQSIPRIALGAHLNINLLKVATELNKIIKPNETEVSEERSKKIIEVISANIEGFRDFKKAPISVEDDREGELLFPFKNEAEYKTFLSAKTNSLLDFTFFDVTKADSKKLTTDEKSIYRLLAKIDKYKTENPIEYTESAPVENIDDIYLELLGNKKKQNKISYDKKSTADDFTQVFFKELHGNKKILSNQNRDNMNKKSISYSIAKYQINQEVQDEYSKIQNEIDSYVDVLRKNDNKQPLGIQEIKGIKEKLAEIYTRYKDLKAKTSYQLQAINLMTTGEVEFRDRMLPTGMISLGNKQTFTQEKLMGQISFDYNSDKTLNNIDAQYYFV